MSRGKINLKSDKQIALMRDAGRLVAETHSMIQEHVRPGVTTAELDRITEAYIRLHGGVPSFKGFHGFPASICVAVNDQVVHGIPGNQVLGEGDVIALDIGAILNGWHGDSCWTYAVGAIDSESQRLMDVCHDSLFIGIEQAKAGKRLTDISFAIEQYVNANGFAVVRDLFGHGIGRSMHEAPSLPHYGPAGDGPVLKPGMVFTIEPMIVAGSPEVLTLRDGWTIITKDGSRSAQYEHTIAITNNGPQILTLP
jgi:methionyl aminopeptidase